MPNNAIDSTREIRVFLSSTFKDMQVERDYLLKHVFPEVRERCTERGVGFTEIDLRWGVTEEEAKNGTTIAICLSEIDRCRGFPPFFIGFLGERYGWVPSREDLACYLERRDLNEYAAEIEMALESGISVTELEFQYALQGQRQDQIEALFYLRSPELTQALFQQSEAKQKSDFYDAADGRMDALKQRLRKSPLLEIDNYASIEVFGESIKDQLLAELARRYPQSESADPCSQLRRPHINFARTRLTCYVPLANARRDILDYCRKRLCMEEKRNCLIQGESGLGKSALIADLARYLPTQIEGAEVIDYYVGADGQRSIEQWRDELLVLLTGSQAKSVQDTKNAQEMDRWQFLEAQLHETSKSREGRTLILLLDALNQAVDVAVALHQLRQLSLPQGVILILSATPEVETNKEDVWTYPLGIPDITQLRDMIGAYTHNYRKALAPDLVERIAGASAATLPLYLRVVLEQLRVRAVHENLRQDLEALLQYASVGDLFQHLLETWDRDFCDSLHPKPVSRLAGLLAVSRVGLSEEQLGELMASETDPDDCQSGRPRLSRQLLSQLLAVLRPYLLRNAGREQLMHSALQSTVLNYCEEKSLRKILINGCASERDWSVTERIYQHSLLSLHEFKSGSKQGLVTELSLPENLKKCYRTDQGTLRLALQAIGAGESELNRHTEALVNGWLEKFSLSDDLALNREITSNLLDNSYLNVGVAWAEQILKSSKRACPAGHPSIIIDLVNLAVGYRALGRLAEAEIKSQEALEACRKSLPEGDLNIAVALSCMADIFRDQNRLNEAGPLYQEALAIYLKLLPVTHFRIAKTISDLAGFYISLKQFDSAEDLLQVTLTMLRKSLPEGHPDIARTLVSLAVAYLHSRRLSEAEASVLDALAIRRKTLPVGHPENAQCIKLLAETYRAQGRLDDADAMNSIALGVYSAALPEKHWKVQKIRSEILIRVIEPMSSSRTVGKYARLQSNVVARRKTLPEEHPGIADALFDLADEYNGDKLIKDAEPLYLEALSIYRKAFTKGDPSIGIRIAKVADFYINNGVFNKAEPLYLESLKVLNKNLPAGHPEILACIDHILTMYLRQVFLFFKSPLLAFKAGWAAVRVLFVCVVK
ncbi:hypothetical protein PMI26_05819 [Pseudomonas sp. GM33]|uniref:tetratricopeptide repeat protein n=1 Tax=Pseudomonas sp. GM33 TaxID=1144329 RepID=UPI0002700B3D|nr:tetratricopeptide repeat protein [Pseudomonas sp. GM33]EJM34331.1 hypothetical protein PMI26_05819 [Pseudomonas sp. GM33]